MIGQMLNGRYHIHSPIGRGGMGTVYQANDCQQNKVVAIKVLRPILNSPEMVARFTRECEVLSSFSHANIVQALDYGRYDGLPYLVMELLTGHTLQEALKNGPLPHHFLLDVANQIAEALIAIHQRDIVHRDLKPSNVMLVRQGNRVQVKLMDFGLVQTAELAQRANQEGSTLGTVAYIAPEQVQGLALDFRADLYAFGAMMYEMATGQPPFVHENLGTILLHQITKRPAHPGQLNPFLDEALARLILQLLEKEPERRPQSTKSVAQQLAHLAVVPSLAPTFVTEATGL